MSGWPKLVSWRWRGKIGGGRGKWGISAGRRDEACGKRSSRWRNSTGSISCTLRNLRSSSMKILLIQVGGYHLGGMDKQINSLSKFLNQNFEIKTNKTVSMSCFSLISKTILISLVFKIPKTTQRFPRFFCLNKTNRVARPSDNSA